MKKLRIAQMASLIESIPPERYGGTELVVSNLTEELVKRGHEVTLFASGDSKTKAKLVSVCSRALRKDKWTKHQLFYIPLLDAVFSQRHNFDILHNHIFTVVMPLNKTLPDVPPIITTLHGRLDLPEYRQVVLKYPENMYYISISNAQRKALPELNYVATIYNGIDISKFEFGDKPKNYFIFLGRISPEKGIGYAIDLARLAKIKLIIAAKVDKVDYDYYKSQIKPKIDGKLIRFIGEVDHPTKVGLLKNAKALINPIDWEEPFGLTMIEALACGTPVIAPRRASVPEIIIDNKTGFVVNPDSKKIVIEMCKALKKIDQIDRLACRKHVEKNFTVKKMVDDYEKVYYKILKIK